MLRLAMMTVGMVLCFSAVASAQPNVTFDSPFQVRAVTKLKKGDLINITNTGAANANLCAHVYAFDQTGQFLACCSCVVAPNTLTSLTVGADVLEGRKPFPKAAVFKVLGATTIGGTCNGAGPGALASGLGVWKGEAAFMPSTLSAGELNALTTRCGFLHAVANICPVCRTEP